MACREPQAAQALAHRIRSGRLSGRTAEPTRRDTANRIGRVNLSANFYYITTGE
jgi:hypothetical protein